MNNQTGLIFKIILLSGFLSMLVKYGGRLLPIKPHTSIALSIVLLPALILWLLLWWRGKNQTTTIEYTDGVKP